MLNAILNPAFPRFEVPCRPFGWPAVLVLVVPPATGRLGAVLLVYPGGEVRDATIGRA